MNEKLKFTIFYILSLVTLYLGTSFILWDFVFFKSIGEWSVWSRIGCLVLFLLVTIGVACCFDFSEQKKKD